MVDAKPLAYEWKGKTGGVLISVADSAFATATVPMGPAHTHSRARCLTAKKNASVNVTARVHPKDLYEAGAE
ncbi:MAG: hypothetical protein J1D88_05795 [Treponema sp.]|nr:hypothetical protein [Treponema sp.]